MNNSIKRNMLIAVFAGVFVLSQMQIGFSQTSTPKVSKKVNGNIIEVEVEGVGTTREDAQKDAYRNALREVVGMYVESKTIVANDDIIEDKILSVSNGIIKKATTLSSNNPEKDELWRLKVRVEVERTVMTKVLKESNIEFIDGESLFADATMKKENRENSAEILKGIFSKYPSVIKGSIVGKPAYNNETKELVYTLSLATDDELYSKYLKELTTALDSIAVKKLPVTTQKMYEWHGSTEFARITGFKDAQNMRMRFTNLSGQIPRFPNRPPNYGIVSVMSYWTSHNSIQTWKNYVVDLGSVNADGFQVSGEKHWLCDLAPIGYYVEDKKKKIYASTASGLKIHVDFLDAQGTSVKRDTIYWNCNYNAFKNPWLQRHQVPMFYLQEIMEYNGKDILGWNKSLNGTNHNFWLSIAPYCFSFMGKNGECGVFRKSNAIIRKIKTEPGVLKNFKDVRVSFELVPAEEAFKVFTR